MEIKIDLPYTYQLMAFYRIDDESAYILVRLPDSAAKPFAAYRIHDGRCVWGDYIHTENAADAHRCFQERFGFNVGDSYDHMEQRHGSGAKGWDAR